MDVRVLREACCAQDDQLGPLDARYALAADASLRALVDQVVGSRFLQYSSSHTTLVGEVDGQRVVRVFSPFHCAGRDAEYLVPAERRVDELLGGRALSFRFVFD